MLAVLNSIIVMSVVPKRTITFSFVVLYLSCICKCLVKIAPDFIHPCNTTNPECLTQATQDAISGFVKGIPELGIPSLDPFMIEKLELKLPGGLTFTFTDGKVVGLKNCIVNNVTAELGINLNIDVTCSITIRGKYKSSGRVLLFPIDGDGDMKIKIVNMRMKVNHETELVTDKQGVHHVLLKSYKYDVEYGDKVTFAMTNLFKGSPELSQTVLSFFNENWRLVLGEFGRPIVDNFLELTDKHVKDFFLAVPYEELIDIPFGIRTQ